MNGGGPARLDLRGRIPDADALAPAVRHLERGGLLAYPTETVYGFGGALLPGALTALRRLKRREEHPPFLLLVSDRRQTEGLGWSGAARELAEVFWPGGLTLVLPDPEGIFPGDVRGPGGGVAVRLTPHPVAAALCDGIGGPITSTSANRPGHPPALDAEAARAAAGSLGAGPEVLVLDGGTLEPSPPSTIVDCTGPDPVVVREGVVPTTRLGCAVPGIHGR